MSLGDFRKIIILISTFWATKWSLETQNIFLSSLEHFLKDFQKLLHFFFFFSKSRGILSKVLHVKNDFPGAVIGPKIASESKNSIFSKSKIMIPQSDWGKRNVKLMLVRPKKDFTIIWALHEKNSTFRFFDFTLTTFWDFPYRLVRAKSKNRKIEIFSGRTQMIVKQF